MSPRGSELALATTIRNWARSVWPELSWTVTDLGNGAANLEARMEGNAADLLLFYSHLDTSLTGDQQLDRLVTGRADQPLDFCWDEEIGKASGFGLAVARAPAAAALVGFATAARNRQLAGDSSGGLGLLLSSSGTHSSRFAEHGQERPMTGVERYLESHQTPTRVVVAKCGPHGILHNEPGAGYLKVTLGTEMKPAIFARSADPPGGLVENLPDVVNQITNWRAEIIRKNRKKVGPESVTDVVLGAIRSGSARKPDLLPGIAELHLYVILGPAETLENIAASLNNWLKQGLAKTTLARGSITIETSEEAQAAETDRSGTIVRHAEDSWREVFGDNAAHIEDWNGSTDGVVFRRHGSEVVRLGPSPVADEKDDRRDVVEIDQLVKFSEIYAHLGMRS